MKNTEPREGYLNRHVDPLPLLNCHIKIIINDSTGERTEICYWKPVAAEPKPVQPHGIGYLGTAWNFNRIGFNAIEQNNQEFIYYQPI
jgi:hypothetical protein